MIIRKMTIKDLGSVARIHKEVYTKDHFTAHFNFKMLTNYYGELLKSTKHAYVSNEGGGITGFLIAGDSLAAGVKQFVIKNWLGLLLISLLNPQFILRKIGRMFAAKKRNKSTKMQLFSIAVTANAQRSGTGEALVKELEKGLIDEGTSSYVLYVKPSNKKAIDFYYKCGFAVEREDKLLVVFRKKLNG